MIGASVMILLDDSIGAQWVKIIENLNIHFSKAHEINYYIYKSYNYNFSSQNLKIHSLKMYIMKLNTKITNLKIYILKLYTATVNFTIKNS